MSFSSFIQSIYIVFEHNYLVISMSCFIKSTTRGTIKEKPGFNPGEDAAALRKAIEGIGKALTWVWTFSKFTLHTFN